MMKNINAVAPVIFAAGLTASCGLAVAEEEAREAAVPAVLVNPAPAAICAHETPLFGAAFSVKPPRINSREFGIEVTFVKEGTPAHKIGIRAGDVLLCFDGQKIFFPIQFSALLRTYRPGDDVSVEFLRGKKILSANATLASRGGNAVARKEKESGIVPEPTEKSDIRLLINGREIILSQGGAWRDRIAITPDALIIRTSAGVPDDLRAFVENFRRRLPDPRAMAAEFKMDVLGAKEEFFKRVSTFEQVFFGDGKTVILTGENDLRRVTVRDGEREIFRGPCTTQEEIDAIPADAKKVIDSFTELRPAKNATKNPESKETAN